MRGSLVSCSSTESEMKAESSSTLKMLWLIPPILIGIIILLFMKGNKQAPEVSDAGEVERLVRTQIIEKTDFVPVARGFGVVQPAHVWKAIAQVSGRITKLHPRLNNGEIIQQGETLFQIDPVDYELKLVQAETELAELDVEKTNSSASLEIEKRNLALARKEFQRLQNLLKKGSVSRSDADNAERTMLNSTTQVQNLKNTLALLPSKIKLQQAQVTQAQRDLDNTQVKAPFNMRVSALSIESDQFVSNGQHMFSGDSVDRVEITAQVAMSSLKNLFLNSTATATNLDQLSTGLADLTGFKPTIRLDMGNEQVAEWAAEFIRFSDSVDSETRTMGVVIAVDKPMQQIIPGIRPPLSKGMFVEVNIAGKVQKDSIVIPRSALRNGKAYVVDAQNRLSIKAVTKNYDQQQFSVIAQGLNAGDQLVLTDLIPAVEGMLLKPMLDSAGE